MNKKYKVIADYCDHGQAIGAIVTYESESELNQHYKFYICPRGWLVLLHDTEVEEIKE